MSAGKQTSLDPGVQLLAKVCSRAKNPDVPADLRESLEQTLDIVVARSEYCHKHTLKDTPNARMIVEKTCALPWKELHEQGKVSTLFNNLYMSGSGQGQVLQFLARMQRAKGFLEIGMFTGYAAMAVAEVLPVDGKVVTCEFEPYLVETARGYFDQSPFGKKIDIREGPAAETLDQLASEGQQFDLVYLDANKDGYLGYFKSLLDKHLLAEGGTLMVDNTFWAGHAYTEPGSVMDVFNEAVSADPRVEQVMLSICDGVSLIRRKGE